MRTGPGNFILSVDGEQVKGTFGYFGIVFHRRSWDEAYLVGIEPSTERYFVTIAHGGRSRDLRLARLPRNVLNEGAQNLTVLVISGHFEIFVNGHYIAQFHDRYQSGGRIGLGAGVFSDEEVARFVFDNFEYYQVVPN